MNTHVASVLCELRLSSQDEMADAGNAASFAVLPLPILHDIFFLLPIDQRLLLSAVSRGLRAAFAATVLWQNVDLSRGSGVCTLPSKSKLLRAIIAKAAGTMVSLHVTDLLKTIDGLFLTAVREAVRANSVSLRRLSVFGCEDADPVVDYEAAALSIGLVEGLLADAPRLDFLETDVWCHSSNARRVLRNERPYGVLRARRVCIDGAWGSVVCDFAVRAVQTERKKLIG